MTLIDKDKIEWYKKTNEKGEFLGFVADKEQIERLHEYKNDPESKDIFYTFITFILVIEFILFIVKFLG